MSSTFEIRRVVVIGAGTMGHGIAGQAARFGYDVVLNDIDDARVNKGLSAIEAVYRAGVDKGKLAAADAEAARGRLRGASDLEAAVAGADLVVEAVFEDPTVKAETTRRAERHLGADAIFATNTSTCNT